MHRLLEQLLRQAAMHADTPPTGEQWRGLLAQADRALAQAEAEFAEERERLEAVIASISHGLCAVDSHGRLLSINPEGERLLLWRQSQLLAQPVLDLVCRQDGDQPQWREALAAGRSFHDETSFVRKDGRSFPVSYTLNPILRGGEVTGGVLVFRDISDRRELEESLIEARDVALEAARAKSEFLATMSHEIRTPLNGVIGMTTLLLDTELTEQQREYSEIATSSAEALLGLVNDILDFSKIEANEMGLEVIEYDLLGLVEDVLDLLAPQAQRKGLELASLVEPDVPLSLFGDPYRLRQIVINLLGNAVKFTDHGSVTVVTRLAEISDDSVKLRFEVKDTGIGISPQAMRRLFSPFTQADSSTTRRYGGTGLGLAICKKLTSLMAGDIGISSSPGQGSTFWFTVRQKRSQAAPAPTLSVPTEDASVLIVDPCRPAAELLAQQLRAWGMDTHIANGTSEAVAMAQSAHGRGRGYALAMIDRSSPGLDAGALGLQLREIEDTQLVLLTPLSDTATHPHDPNFIAQLPKPVRRRILHATVCSALRPGGGAAAPRRPQSSRLSAVRLQEQKGRALVADDNLVNQKVAVHMLARLGLAVDVAHDGADAVAAAARTRYDLILMDCQMPNVDGFEATRSIRSGGASRSSPIIALTANAIEGNQTRCTEAGMDDCLTKPVKLQDLARTVEKWTSAQ